MAMTELQAVNVLLAAIGEAPVNTLDSNGLIDAAIAQTFLTNTRAEVQARGWWFNKETEYPLSVDVNNNIVLPTNTLHVDTSDVDGFYDVVERGGMLYDRKNHTFEFTNVTTLKCDIVFNLDFTDLPFTAQWYITVRAARLFQSGYVGSESLHRFTSDHEKEALSFLLAAEADSEDVNVLNNTLLNSIAFRTFNP